MKASKFWEANQMGVFCTALVCKEAKTTNAAPCMDGWEALFANIGVCKGHSFRMLTIVLRLRVCCSPCSRSP